MAEVQPSSEQLIHIPRFSPEQRQGLEASGFTMFLIVQPISINQMLENPDTKSFFGSIPSFIRQYSESEGTEGVLDIIPVTREVAINPSLSWASSELLHIRKKLEKYLGFPSFAQEEKMIMMLVQNLKREKLPQKANLNGIDFGVDHASVYCQLDLEYQKRHDGKKLLGADGYMVSTRDIVRFDPPERHRYPDLASKLSYIREGVYKDECIMAMVGRSGSNNKLTVLARNAGYTGYSSPQHWGLMTTMPVATPMTSRRLFSWIAASR